MLEILSAPPHLAAYRFEGELTGDDYDACIADLERRFATHARIDVFCDLSGYTGLSAEALGKDLRYAFTHPGAYRRIARTAIVTDRRWIGAISEFAGRFFPHTEVRSFEPAQRDAAFGWASEAPENDGDAPGPKPPSAAG